MNKFVDGFTRIYPSGYKNIEHKIFIILQEIIKIKNYRSFFDKQALTGSGRDLRK